MQIVIDIDEESYEYIKAYANEEVLPIGWYSIINGTPLPKGHGRLIDADRLKIDNPLHMGLDIPYVTEHTVEGIIDHAPTIIEADENGK